MHDDPGDRQTLANFNKVLDYVIKQDSLYVLVIV